MKRIHWKLGIMTMLTAGMGLIVIGDACTAQGHRGGGGNQGGGNQGGGNSGGNAGGNRNAPDPVYGDEEPF